MIPNDDTSTPAYEALKEYSLKQEKELTEQLESLQSQFDLLKSQAYKLEGERDALLETIKLLLGRDL